ncbi:Amidohydrolase 2 [Penicillium concentricum]|uniref:Amidohydrolase 2 n=1 Tax=Penicillium concentricum TaxID=293559 RepID=A0A9W9RU26_9EURO|nr:Amidohydrolase 2 [Penicillium concentricum]KAJ5365655.1 Amidohydrolase 2 [Penicillium concentricum]
MLTTAQAKTNVLRGPPSISFDVLSTRLEQRRSTHVSAASVSLKQRLPPKSWDSHMHVVEPERFPVSPTAVYKPKPHTLREALAFESGLGVENLVFVQPSVYGTDNSCLLDALRRLGPSRGRGVVVVDPATVKPETLDEWHTLGVRGLRINLQSVGKVMDKTELEETLLQHAKLARPRNWIIEIYLPLKMVSMVESILPRLGVRICIDHFGSPELTLWENDGAAFNPYTLQGFSSLISLLRAGRTYVKVSAPYRLSKDHQMRDLQAMAREFLSVAPNRVIYATDWPHTRFSSIDISPFTECCLELCATKPGLAERLFRRNTEEMLGVVSD